MTEGDKAPDRAASGDAELRSKKPLTPAAERALAEAAERRAERQAQEQAKWGTGKEVGGPSGPEPTRYGDWEKKGLTSDF